jgi:hypothetical protein
VNLHAPVVNVHLRVVAGVVGINVAGTVEAAGAWVAVDRNRTAAFCCLECRNSDFQQLNGRNVGAMVAMVVMVEE